jgi:hydrogenase/urease accessory protein HupE
LEFLSTLPLWVTRSSRLRFTAATADRVAVSAWNRYPFARVNIVKPWWQCWAFLALGLLFAQPGFAHEIGLSSSVVQLHTNRLEALLTFAVREMEEVLPLDADQDGVTSPAEFQSNQDALTTLLLTNCPVRFDGSNALPSNVRCLLDSSNNVELSFSCELSSFKQLELSYEVIRLLTPGHRMLFTLVAPSGEVLADRLLSQNSPVVSVQLDLELPASTNTNAPTGAPPAPTPILPKAPPTFVEFTKLGVEHILIGYDHLLFLFALLIVTRDFWAALKVITCFTIAHSVTLAVATLDLMHLPGHWVEPMIALTIIYVGIENIVCKGNPPRRWLLTFVFGLIHGFGFAAVLRELGIGAHGGVILPLFSFNLGVELGQIAVAALALPVIWQLRKSEFFLRKELPACSVVVALLGVYWFVQRVWF